MDEKMMRAFAPQVNWDRQSSEIPPHVLHRWNLLHWNMHVARQRCDEQNFKVFVNEITRLKEMYPGLVNHLPRAPPTPNAAPNAPLTAPGPSVPTHGPLAPAQAAPVAPQVAPRPEAQVESTSKSKASSETASKKAKASRETGSSGKALSEKATTAKASSERASSEERRSSRKSKKSEKSARKARNSRNSRSGRKNARSDSISADSVDSASTEEKSERRQRVRRFFMPLPQQRFRWMKHFEIEQVLRHQLYHLESDDPLTDDFYFQVDNARKGGEWQGVGLPPLGSVSLRKTQNRHADGTPKLAEGTLGVVALKTIRRPRKLLAMAAEAESGTPGNLFAKRTVAHLIEEGFRLLLEVEDVDVHIDGANTQIEQYLHRPEECTQVETDGESVQVDPRTAVAALRARIGELQERKQHLVDTVLTLLGALEFDDRADAPSVLMSHLIRRPRGRLLVLRAVLLSPPACAARVVLSLAASLPAMVETVEEASGSTSELTVRDMCHVLSQCVADMPPHQSVQVCERLVHALPDDLVTALRTPIGCALYGALAKLGGADLRDVSLSHRWREAFDAFADEVALRRALGKFVEVREKERQYEQQCGEYAMRPHSELEAAPTPLACTASRGDRWVLAADIVAMLSNEHLSALQRDEQLFHCVMQDAADFAPARFVLQMLERIR